MNKPSHNPNLAIEQFLMQVERRAFVMARIATGDEEEALDIVQDAMIKLVDNYANKQSDEWPPLFHCILQSRINDWQRKQKVRNRWRRFIGKGEENDKHAENRSEDSNALENHSAEKDALPDEILSHQQFSHALEKALVQLPLRQKQAFMLRAWEAYSVRQTSQIMNCSEGSVKTHYSRARETLQKLLTDRTF